MCALLFAFLCALLSGLLCACLRGVFVSTVVVVVQCIGVRHVLGQFRTKKGLQVQTGPLYFPSSFGDFSQAVGVGVNLFILGPQCTATYSSL